MATVGCRCLVGAALAFPWRWHDDCITEAMNRSLLIATVLATLSLSSAARAEDSRPPGRWYGWQTLTVDGGSLALGGTLLGLGAESSTVRAVGGSLLAGGYVLGAPTVHWAHGRIGRGFISLGLRASVPLATGLIAYGLHRAGGGGGLGDNDCGLHEDCSGPAGWSRAAGAGLLLGAAGVIALDAAVLARTSSESAPRAGRLHWMPTGGYDPVRRAATVGLTASF